jgi:uncharacterized membrane protein
MKSNLNKRELLHAQLALMAAIVLQVAVVLVNKTDSFGPQYILIATEAGLAVLLASTINARTPDKKSLQRLTAGGLLGFISLGNITSLGIVLYSLIVTHTELTGAQLLASALAIFMTNIIVYALWYWEIDSPGLTSKRWSKHDKDFQFTQQDMPREFPGWRPEFVDYLYLSITNAINFAPADTRPITRGAKLLMASQGLVSVFTLALLIARSVSILGT